jgi:hypothetical protein
MGIKNLFWKIVRNGKPAPYQHGPTSVIRNAKGKWEDGTDTKEESLCPVIHVTAKDLGCNCGGNCKCNPHTNQQTPKPTAAKKPAAKKPAPKQK